MLPAGAITRRLSKIASNLELTSFLSFLRSVGTLLCLDVARIGEKVADPCVVAMAAKTGELTANGARKEFLRRDFGGLEVQMGVGDVTSPIAVLGITYFGNNWGACHGHSLLLSSYLHRISRKENSACSACGHPLQDLNHLLLDCPASEPLRKSIFGSSLSILDLWSRPWGVARLLGLRGVPPRPHPSEGVG